VLTRTRDRLTPFQIFLLFPALVRERQQEFSTCGKLPKK